MMTLSFMGCDCCDHADACYVVLYRKNPKLLLDDRGAEERWKRITKDSETDMALAKKFRQEFSNVRLMMARMSNRLSQKTGFDPNQGKDATVSIME